MRLFISYPRKDTDKTLSLVDLLRQGGHQVWLDTQLQTGQPWQEQLQQQILAADGVVLALTPNWLQSSWCQWEFVTAVEAGKKIIPVLLANNPDGSRPAIPQRISQYQWADMTGGLADEQRNQKLLDDLLTLAVLPGRDVLAGMDRQELEARAAQEIHTGDLIGSTVNITQQTGPQPAADQSTRTGHISHSTVTIEQKTIENQTIVHTRPANTWNSAVIVATVLTVLGVVVTIIIGIFQSLPEQQRNNLLYSAGLVPASPTATPTLTPTFTPTPTPTPAPTLTPTPTPPEPLRAADYNVAVAGFAYQQADGTLIRDRLADNMSDILADELNQITRIDSTLGWRSAGVGHILGQTPAAREAQAAAIAAALNLDVVIYGVVRSDGIFNIFEPEFYISGAFASVEPDMVGSDNLGNPVEFVGNSDDQIKAANAFQRRLAVMRHFVSGLAFYLAGNFADAQQEFEEAITVEVEGLEIVYVFAGNAAIRVPDPAAALTFYDTALGSRPAYARALIGRGIALYQQARQAAGTTPPPYRDAPRLDHKQTCADTAAPLPREPWLLAELALRCYREAGLSRDQPPTADIDLKVAFGLGQTSLWLSSNGYGDYWQDTEKQLTTVLTLYTEADEARRLRIRAAAGHASAWLGLRLLLLDGQNPASVQQARLYYRTAAAWLRDDVNREYNRRWIDLYEQQVEALEDWLQERGLPLVTMTPLTAPTPTPYGG